VGLVGKDVTLESAAAIAATIQREVADRFELGASIGVGPNKLIAKMASGVQKPRGLMALDPEGFRRTFWPRDIQTLWGVGPQLATRMRSLGITTVGELAHAPVPALKASFGIIGPQLREAAWGRDETPLVPYHRGVEAKSMGHEVTLPEDCAEEEYLLGTLLRLSDQVARRMRTEGYVGDVVTVKIRRHDFETLIRQRALAGYTDDHLRIYEVASGLLRKNWTHEPLRLIGVSVSGLARRSPSVQSELFDEARRDGHLRDALDRLRDRLGEASVVPAGSLAFRRQLGHVPFGAVSSRGRPVRRS
jgi:DNA polymerase-4